MRLAFNLVIGQGPAFYEADVSELCVGSHGWVCVSGVKPVADARSIRLVIGWASMESREVGGVETNGSGFGCEHQT